MSEVRPGGAVNTRCVICMMTGENVISDQMAYERSLRDTTMMRMSVLKVSRNNIASVRDENKVVEEEERDNAQKWWKKYSLSTWPSVLEILIGARRV